jgi:hypothetical protein
MSEQGKSEKTHEPMPEPPIGWKNCHKCGTMHPEDMPCEWKTYHNKPVDDRVLVG